MHSRREFLGAVGLPAVAAGVGLKSDGRSVRLVLSRLDRLADPGADPAAVAGDDDVWAEVARAFTVDRSLINLNNGGVSPAPLWVQQAMKRHLDDSNECPPYTMWRVLQPQKEGVRQRLAREFGCDPEELAITRNASEGLQICQFGFDLEPGDEVLCTTQDYGRMVTTFKQRARRERIVLEQFKIPTPCEDPDEVVDLYRRNITPKTRLILVCHVINLTGQILPVTEITALGREHGIPVIVDGAHALAHVDFKFDELDVDYYATSLHKWLFAPHGTGLLYVRRDKIEGLWPLMAANEKQDADIRKFEEIGTHPAANHNAIAEALTFHEAIGGERKAARLRYLRDRWMERVEGTPGVRLYTSRDPAMGCAISTVGLDGVETPALADHLWTTRRIYVTSINHEEFNGIRVTPNVYTTLEEIDRFAEALESVVESGLPAT
jgi:isopenicillin-N epimerase